MKHTMFHENTPQTKAFEIANSGKKTKSYTVIFPLKCYAMMKFWLTGFPTCIIFFYTTAFFFSL